MAPLLNLTRTALHHYYFFGGAEHLRRIIAGIESAATSEDGSVVEWLRDIDGKGLDL